MDCLVTTLGPVRRESAGLILPHEHVFTDLRRWDEPGYAQADPDDVVRTMVPRLEAARRAGIGAIVECTPVGVGRRADLLQAVSEASGMPLLVPTGVYREPWMPERLRTMDEGALKEWMRAELTEGIEDTGVLAAWIKLSAGDDGMTPAEARVLVAAARAALPLRALIGSHTVRGAVVREQLDRIGRVGCPPGRFVWIHAQVEPDFALNLEMARRGCWIEYDAIGSPEQDERILDRILRMLDRGFADRVLLSQDRGWYDPAKPGGGSPLPYESIVEDFLPRLRAAGVDEATVRRLVSANPFEAFAREPIGARTER